MDALNNNNTSLKLNFVKTETKMEAGKEYIEIEIVDEDGDVRTLYLDMEQSRDLINDLTKACNEYAEENLELNIMLDEMEGELEFMRDIWAKSDNRLN